MAIQAGPRPTGQESITEPRRRDRLRWAPSPLFLAGVLCFTLPFVTVSCGHDHGTMTGMQLATASGIDAHSSGLALDISQKLPDLMAVIALWALVVGVFVALPGRKHGPKGALIVATTAVLALAAIPVHLEIRFLFDTLYVRYGWILAVTLGLFVVAVEDLMSIRARVLRDGSVRALSATTTRSAALMLALFSVGVIPILLVAPDGDWAVWSVYAVFLAILALVHGATEGRSPADQDARRAAWSGIGLILGGVAVAATGALRPVQQGGLAPVAVVAGGLAFLAGFILLIRALRRVGPGVRGRWPALIGTALVSLPVYGLLLTLLLIAEGG
jgi:multisubunit Na+/H+ antiporter MnhB subunit